MTIEIQTGKLVAFTFFFAAVDVNECQYEHLFKL